MFPGEELPAPGAWAPAQMIMTVVTMARGKRKTEKKDVATKMSEV